LWEEWVREIDRKYEQQLKEYHDRLIAWEQACLGFQEKQRRQQADVDARKAEYLAHNPAAVLHYCKHVLAKSQYPAGFPKSCVLEYLLDSKTVIAEYQLPHISVLPITQASRDGGVDAIAFDPDPIRGGKIVIQAKRYTNTVSVSAVRDLYGTVVNEGATKGILVTTADYGRDAYEFAKDKPITLLSGSELHLLEQHGHRARIDLVEARKLERNRDKGINAFGSPSDNHGLT